MRQAINWKMHPLRLSDTDQLTLKQVWSLSVKDLKSCAISCQQSMQCSTFTFNQKQCNCTAVQRQIYQADLAETTDDLYYVILCKGIYM